jgi:DNA polymerase III subunit delta
VRYQNFRAFRKHLASAAPDHLCRCYLVVVPDDYERAVAIQAILAHFQGKPHITLNGEDAVCREAADALLSPSLFGGEPVVVLDDAEKMGKKELQALSDLAGRSPPYGYLLCGARSKTSISAAFEKAGVVFDLADEKPWDKEKRLAEQISERVQNASKRLASDAIPLLFERLGSDAALLDSEIDKLVCYVGTRPMIERSDVFRISASSRELTLWQMAEAVVWEGENVSVDPSAFHSFLPALRSQLQTGLKLADFLAANIPREEWSAYLPRIWPKTLEKRSGQAAKLGRSFFKKGLDLLFSVELLSRTGSAAHEGALLDFFRMKLHE